MPPAPSRETGSTRATLWCSPAKGPLPPEPSTWMRPAGRSSPVLGCMRSLRSCSAAGQPRPSPTGWWKIAALSPLASRSPTSSACIRAPTSTPTVCSDTPTSDRLPSCRAMARWPTVHDWSETSAAATTPRFASSSSPATPPPARSRLVSLPRRGVAMRPKRWSGRPRRRQRWLRSALPPPRSPSPSAPSPSTTRAASGASTSTAAYSTTSRWRPRFGSAAGRMRFAFSSSRVSQTGPTPRPRSALRSTTSGRSSLWMPSRTRPPRVRGTGRGVWSRRSTRCVSPRRCSRRRRRGCQP